MNHTVEQLRSSLIGIRGSTIAPSLVETVRVEFCGQLVSIKQVSSIAKVSAGISIFAYDPQMAGVINKALLAANFKSYLFSPKCVMVPVPPMSGEQRKEIIKHLRRLAEDAKVAIRNLRKKFRQTLTKDELSSVDKELQLLTDTSIANIDAVIEDRIQKL